MNTDSPTHQAALRTLTALKHNGGYTIEAFDGSITGAPRGAAVSRDAVSLGLTSAQARGLVARGWLAKDHQGGGAITYAVTARGALAAVRIALVELRLALHKGEGYVAREDGIWFADMILRDLVQVAPAVRFSLVAASRLERPVSKELSYLVREIAGLVRTFCKGGKPGIMTAAALADVGRILQNGATGTSILFDSERVHINEERVWFDQGDANGWGFSSVRSRFVMTALIPLRRFDSVDMSHNVDTDGLDLIRSSLKDLDIRLLPCSR